MLENYLNYDNDENDKEIKQIFQNNNEEKKLYINNKYINSSNQDKIKNEKNEKQSYNVLINKKSDIITLDTLSSHRYNNEINYLMKDKTENLNFEEENKIENYIENKNNNKENIISDKKPLNKNLIINEQENNYNEIIYNNN